MKSLVILVVLLLSSFVFGQHSTVSPISSPPSTGSDGLLCATNVKNAWLDLAIVLELSDATASQWDAITGNILSYLSNLSLNNTAIASYTSRVSIIGYTSATEATLIYALTDTQALRNIQFALKNAKPTNIVSGKPNIASGLSLANRQLRFNQSFRVMGVILYAATYDDSGKDHPVVVANEIKTDLIKIATVSYDAANGVNTPKISALASPGLALTSEDDLPVIFSTVAHINVVNCRCPTGWHQLVVNNVISYADCFYYQNVDDPPGCDGSAILAVANTPPRLDFITQLASNWTLAPTSEINVGLVRYNANSPWIWQDGQAYSDTAYPAFAQTPSETDTYGYLTKKNSNNWQLLSDDSLKPRHYVCQRRACDANHLCDLFLI